MTTINPIAGAPALSTVDFDAPVLAYQPIVALPSERLWAIEGLFRPIAGDPAAALEAAGARRPQLERRVLAAAFEDAAEWCRVRGAVLSVNVSTDVAAEPETAALVGRLLADRHLAAGSLWVELRNTEVVHPDLLPGLGALAAAGASIVVDGLGAADDNRSAADLCARLPVSGLKISLLDASSQGLVAAARLAAARRIPLLVSQVETDVDLEAATLLGAAAAQGYRFGHPLPLERVAVGAD